MAPAYHKQHDQFDTLATHIHQVGKASTDLDDFLAEVRLLATRPSLARPPPLCAGRASGGELASSS